jgi:hypothetical protein
MSTANMQDDAFRQFDGGLAKVRFEFLKNLTETDLLDYNRLSQMLDLFNQRLIVFQHEFLDYLARAKGGAKGQVQEFVVNAPAPGRIAEMAASILAGGGGALLIALVPVGHTGFWIFATTITAAASVGGALGVPAGAVTAGVGIAVGAGAGIGLALALKPYRRKLIRGVLIKKFDGEIAPRLRDWAKARIKE